MLIRSNFFKDVPKFLNYGQKYKTIRIYCTVEKSDETSENKLSGFAKAFLKQEEGIKSDFKKVNPPTTKSFASLLRESPFIDLGDPEGKLVYGKIFHIVGDDLYIDFGWKFHTVCSRPAKNGDLYVRGAKVRLRIKDLELSSKFLGSNHEITLCEADCTLFGLVDSPVKN